MKYIIYIITICSLIGTQFPIRSGVTYADVCCAILLIISAIKFIKRSWKIDQFCKLTIAYIPIMFLVAIVNSDITNTIFINYFRNYLWGVVVYFALSNSIHTIKDIKVILSYSILFLLMFLLNYKGMIQESYYESIATLDFGYGRNNVAFTALLIAIVFEFLYYSKLAGSYILIGILLMSIIIVFCASRFAMIMLVVSFIIARLFLHKRLSIYDFFSLSLLLAIGLYFYNYASNLVDPVFYQNSIDLLTEKLVGTTDDLIDTRIYLINIVPLSNTVSTDGFGFLLFGKPEAIQHSSFAHTLITTGILGFSVFIITNIKILFLTFRYKGVNIFLFIVVLVMFINDFITNARFIVCMNSILYGVICAILYRYILVNENIHFSKRIYRQ